MAADTCIEALIATIAVLGDVSFGDIRNISFVGEGQGLGEPGMFDSPAPAVSTAAEAAGAAAGTAAAKTPRWALPRWCARVSLSASLHGVTHPMVRMGTRARWCTCGSVMGAASPLHSASTAQQIRPGPNGRYQGFMAGPPHRGLLGGALLVRWPWLHMHLSKTVAKKRSLSWHQ